MEYSNSTLTATHPYSDKSSRLSQVRCMNLDPFNRNYCFSTTVMGTQMSIEVRNLVLRKTPFYFRSSKNAPNVKDLLDIEVQPRVYFRDRIRHLHFYFRCETFMSDAKFLAPGVSASTTEPSSENSSFLELTTSDMYWARLDGLETLNYADHTVVLEICIFTKDISRQPDVGRGLYGMIEQVYIRAKNDGADVKLRHEDFSTGSGEDWTEHLATSGQQWIQSKQHQRPLENTPPSSASPSRDLFDAPIPTSKTNISWKHGLFDDGRYPQCHCSPCEKFATAVCPSCGNAHGIYFSLDDDEGNNGISSIPRQRTRRRQRDEQRAETTTEHGQANRS